MAKTTNTNVTSLPNLLEVPAGATPAKYRKQPEFYTLSAIDTVLLCKALEDYYTASAKSRDNTKDHPDFGHMHQFFVDQAGAIQELFQQVKKARLIRLSF